MSSRTGGGRRGGTQSFDTRLDGAPWILRTPGVSRIVFRMSAKYMRRGFDGLLAPAEERAGTSRSTDESAKRWSSAARLEGLVSAGKRPGNYT